MKRNHVYITETLIEGKWLPRPGSSKNSRTTARAALAWIKRVQPKSKHRLRKYISNPDSGE